jgi:hypothetical protein
MTEDFLGKEIHGNITHYTSRQLEQHDPAELIERLDAITRYPAVSYVTWYQYTPYFNDGDACEFGMHDFRVKLEGIEEGGDYDDGLLDRYDIDHLEAEIPDRENIIAAMYALGKVWEYHEVICQQKFGDPAEVTYDGKTFDVEFYDHD